MKLSARFVKTMLIPLCLLAVFLLLLVLYSLNVSARANAMVFDELSDTAREKKDIFTLKLDDAFDQLCVIADFLDSPEMMSKADTMQRLQKMAVSYDFKALSLANTLGLLVTDTGEEISIADRQYFTNALAGERSIWQNGEQQADGDGGILLSVPVRQGEQTIGVLTGELEEAVVSDALNQNESEGYLAFVCDQDGRVVVGGDETLFEEMGEELFLLLENDSNTKSDSSGGLAMSIRSGTEGTAAFLQNDEKWYIACTPSGINNWSVCLAVPVKALGSALNSLKVEGIVLISAAMGCALLLSLIFVTLNQNALRKSRRERERLISTEEEYRISAQQGGILVTRFEIESGALLSCQGTIEHLHFPSDTAGMGSVDMLAKLVAEESLTEFQSIWTSMRQGRPNGQAEICMKSADGVSRWYSFEYSAIGDGGGARMQAIVTIRDITYLHERMAEFKHWQNLVLASIGKWTAMMEINLSTGVCERIEGEFLEYSQTAQDERNPEQLLKRFEQQAVDPNDQERFHTFFSRNRLLELAGQGIQKDETEIRLLQEDGTVRLCLVTAQMASFPKTGEIKAFFLFKALADSSQEMERLSNLALLDELSGLLNRTAARNAIEEALRFGGGERVALFMIDADNFKQVNDTLGHQHGDQALLQMSRAIKGVFRASDIIARIGGDEFFVFLSEVPAEDFAENKASALCSALHVNYSVEDRVSLMLSASVGVAIARRDQADFDSLYAEADRALYEAKNAGKNRYSIRNSNRAEENKTSQPTSTGYALQMESLMRHLDGGVILLEIGETIEPLYISDGYFMLKGVMGEAIRNGTFPESVIHPHDFALVNDAVRACAADGEPFQISYRNVLAGGGYGWRHMNAVRMPSVRENTSVIAAVITDITELHEATEHLQELACASQIGIFIMRVGERLEITFFNDGALAITGFTYEQMRLFSRDASAFFRGENLQRFREEVRAAIAENRMVDYLYESKGFVGKNAHYTRLYGVKLDVQNDVPSYLILMLDEGDLPSSEIR